MATKILDKIRIPEDRFEMRLSGSGGQGMILAAVIMSEAVGGDRNVVQSQSYGPEARGGASKADVVISVNEIFYQKAMNLDLLLAMTQEALDSYYVGLKEGGKLIVDTTLVTDFPTEDYFGPLTPPGQPGQDSDQIPGAVGIYISEVCWFNARPLTFMLWGGVFERFPKLKTVITEGTTVWAPEYLRLSPDRRGTRSGLVAPAGIRRPGVSARGRHFNPPQDDLGRRGRRRSRALHRRLGPLGPDDRQDARVGA